MQETLVPMLLATGLLIERHSALGWMVTNSHGIIQIDISKFKKILEQEIF